MRTITLNTGDIVLVDDSDFEKASKYRWCLKCQHGTKYAYRTIWVTGENRWSSISLHRYLMNPPPDKQIDHIDGNGLNCQRANMRLCDRFENLRNRGKQRNNKSGFKGVSRGKNKWIVMIQDHNKQIYLGSYTDLILASEAYKRAAVELHGEFAHF